jgi:hypothetical protein
MNPSETFLSQLDRLLSGIVGGVASAIVRRRFPSEAVMRNWSSRLRKAADMIDGWCDGN